MALKKHDFVECQDPQTCTDIRLSSCHRAYPSGRDCGRPRESAVHNPSVDQPVLEAMETVEEAVPSVDDGQPSLSPPGFTRQYLYCQHRWNRTFCNNLASIVLVEEGRPFNLGQRWMVCADHSNHRPPIEGDRRWRRPQEVQ